jgi:hypothetical protein
MLLRLGKQFGFSILTRLSILFGLFRLPGQIRHPVDLLQAIHTQAIAVAVADKGQDLSTQNDMDTITFQDIIVPAFKFAMAMGTGFRHRNCFTPNNITSVDFAAGDVSGEPKKQVNTGLPFLRRLQNLCLTGRSSDLSRLLKPSHPSPIWRSGFRDSGVMLRSHRPRYRPGLTAAGTVADLHGIPF